MMLAVSEKLVASEAALVAAFDAQEAALYEALQLLPPDLAATPFLALLADPGLGLDDTHATLVPDAADDAAGDRSDARLPSPSLNARRAVLLMRCGGWDGECDGAGGDLCDPCAHAEAPAQEARGPAAAHRHRQVRPPPPHYRLSILPLKAGREGPHSRLPAANARRQRRRLLVRSSSSPGERGRRRGGL